MPEAPDTPLDTDVGPQDTTPPAPPDLGPGFVDLTPALAAAFPRDVAHLPWPADDEPDQTHGLFADLDGDGAMEVVLLGTGTTTQDPRAAWVLRYRDGALTPDPALTALLANQDPLILAVADLDGDGRLDVLPARGDTPPRRGRSDGTFEAPRERLRYVPGLMGGAIVDIDHDGWADVVRPNSGCSAAPWTAWMRQSTTAWAQRLDLIGGSVPSSLLAVALVRVAGEEIVLSYGVPCDRRDWAPAFFAHGATTPDAIPSFVGVDITPPNAAYKFDPMVAGGPLTLRNPMGSTVADLDGDGDLDLAIATVDARIMIFEDHGGLPLADQTATRDAALPRRLSDGTEGPFEIMKPWGIAALDLDLDGQLDLITQTGLDFSDWQYAVHGGDTAVVFLQRGGVFVDATAEAGLGSVINGRSLTVGDLDNDGRPDVILGGAGSMPRVLLNRIPGARPPIGVRLRGTTSPAWPAGATVEILDDGARSPTQVVGGVTSPGPISEPAVFGSTGPDRVADLVRVTWPSGYVQEFASLSADRTHVLVEAETVSVVGTRHALADGVATQTLHVVPRAPDGAPRPGTVEGLVVSGTGTVSAAVRTGEGWDLTVTSPGAPGYTVVEVRIDGAPMAVRPRLWWD